jgi:hypothetical protein
LLFATAGFSCSSTPPCTCWCGLPDLLGVHLLLLLLVLGGQQEQMQQQAVQC